MLVEEGVTHVGFPLRLPVNAEDTTEAAARDIIAAIQPEVACVLITYMDDCVEILEFMDFLSVNIVQLHGDVSLATLIELRRGRPSIEIIKSLVVREDNEAQLMEDVQTLSPYVDWFITDTFDPSTGATGATGKTHDWSVSERLIHKSPKPIIMAGGLNHLNVNKAVAALQPAGIDAHTGLEDDAGIKDRQKVREFVRSGLDALFDEN